MNKNDLIAKVAEKVGSTKKDATVFVDALFESITEALANGESIKIHNFGNFEVRERAARKGRNPQTGEEIDIPAKKTPVFKAGKNLKDVVAQGE